MTRLRGIQILLSYQLKMLQHQNLRHLLIDSAETEKSDNIYCYDKVDTAYSTPLNATQGPGRKP